MISRATWQTLMRGRFVALLAVAAVLLHAGLVAQHRGQPGSITGWVAASAIDTSELGPGDRLTADLRLICSPASGRTASLPNSGHPDSGDPDPGDPGHGRSYCPICLGHAPGAAILAVAGITAVPNLRSVPVVVTIAQRPASGLAPGLPRGRGPPAIA